MSYEYLFGQFRHLFQLFAAYLDDFPLEEFVRIATFDRAGIKIHHSALLHHDFLIHGFPRISSPTIFQTAFFYDTAFQSGLSIVDTLKKVKGKTALAFLRYWGCRICQYDVMQFAAGYEKILEENGQLLVVLQSTPENLKEQWGEELPFSVICDPEKFLYCLFEVKPASSKETMADAKTMEKIQAAEELGLHHGIYEGEELQLPATFVIRPDQTVTYAHYGKAVGDVPKIEKLAELLAE